MTIPEDPDARGPGASSALNLHLETRLSPERLGPYVRASGGDLARGIALYAWNSAVSAAFLEVFSMFEVVLRNSLHEHLARWHATTGVVGSWYDDPRHLLDTRAQQDIAEARRRLSRRQVHETPGRVVAELPMGFWRFLLDKRYQTTLWAQALRHAFPHLQPADRRRVYQPVERLHGLRNRVAHHERVFELPLVERHRELLDVLGYIDPMIAAWVSERSRVLQLIETRP